jgi:hypothetical protein
MKAKHDVVTLPVKVPKRSAKADPVAESVASILALLRGVGPVLVGSSPDPETVKQLLSDLKEPHA